MQICSYGLFVFLRSVVNSKYQKLSPDGARGSIYDKATTQKDFTFDDGMPLSCKGPQKTYLRGLHSKKSRSLPGRLSNYEISTNKWINARLAL